MLNFARKLTVGSGLSYTAWRLLQRSDVINLTLRSGLRFQLRRSNAENNDYGVAYEIFVHDYYRDAENRNVRLVVDLGANVGYSVLYFLHEYPSCRVIAFEPHPRHAAQAQRNLRLDGTDGRVEFHAAAAGAKARTMGLTDRKSSSSLTESACSEAILVDVMDIFPLLHDKHIDVLKMDMEGGEYEILADPRFATLDVAAIVMEWHSRGGGLDDKRWCEERLRSLGFATDEIFTRPNYGMFWGRR